MTFDIITDQFIVTSEAWVQNASIFCEFIFMHNNNYIFCLWWTACYQSVRCFSLYQETNNCTGEWRWEYYGFLMQICLVYFNIQFASDVHNTMRNINQRLKQEGGTDIVGEKLFSLYLLVKEFINLRITGGSKYEDSI